jgi:hypothetical protein
MPFKACCHCGATQFEIGAVPVKKLSGKDY